MKVDCESCRAPYQIDERRIPPAGLKMRCPKCGHSFVVKLPPLQSKIMRSRFPSDPPLMPRARSRPAVVPRSLSAVHGPPSAGVPPPLPKARRSRPTIVGLGVTAVPPATPNRFDPADSARICPHAAGRESVSGVVSVGLSSHSGESRRAGPSGDLRRPVHSWRRGFRAAGQP